MAEVEIVKPDDSNEFQPVSSNNNGPTQDLKINITKSDGFILIQFGRPMSQMKMTKRDAREFARRLVKEAL